MASVGAVERPIDRPKLKTRAALIERGREIREARLTRGLSQVEVGRAIETSGSTVSRIERGLMPRVPLVLLCRLASVVSLELSVRTYPGGSPLRDRAHLAILERFRGELPDSSPWRTEVLFPNFGDQRSWDAIHECAGLRFGIEAEMRPRDLQELERRLALKKRDGGVDRLILLLADTRHDRTLVRDHGERLRTTFPVNGRQALVALRKGQDPGGDAIILI